MTRTLGEKAAKQAGRMIRQARRMEELKRIVETDRGLDPMHEVETLMTPDAVTLDTYLREIDLGLAVATTTLEDFSKAGRSR